ncbi:hypothetical protein SAMN04488518_11925 [Pseudovibrio ascidiaceicola]|uniref:Flagellin n=1 Tax=Pseudovibrio ascidiaceicola TaxID=285279 RepID=A0A1I4FIZ7_9HYPH|nr:hypothetical protein [Pseudovibrio ascidiaceicola]SFL16887.1 hypothetical protein SAMN04488518_11925 [Pseudovibrio ascidiaceicola]
MNSVDLNSSSVQLFETQNPVERSSSTLAYFEADESFKSFRVDAAKGIFEPAPLDAEAADKVYAEIFEKDWSEVTPKLKAMEITTKTIPLKAEFSLMNAYAQVAHNTGNYSLLGDQLSKFQENVQAIVADGIEFNPDNPYLKNDEIREKLESILPGSTDGEPNDQTNILTWVLNGEAAENAGMAGINVLTFDFSEMLAGDADVAVGVLAEAFSNWSAALEGVHDSIGSARDAQIEMLSKPEGPVDAEVAPEIEKDMHVELAREKAQTVQSELAKQVFSLANATSPSVLASFSL